MTNEEALKVLVTMAQRAMGNAADHAAVIEAHGVLTAAITQED